MRINAVKIKTYTPGFIDSRCGFLVGQFFFGHAVSSDGTFPVYRDVLPNFYCFSVHYSDIGKIYPQKLSKRGLENPFAHGIVPALSLLFV